MQETECPMCGGGFVVAYGTPGTPEDGCRELYCSPECCDRAEAPRQPVSAAPSAWARRMAALDAAEDPFGTTDPFAE